MEISLAGFEKYIIGKCTKLTVLVWPYSW